MSDIQWRACHSHTPYVCVCECERVSSDSNALKVDKTPFTNYTLLRHFFFYIHPITSAKSSAYKTKVCSNNLRNGPFLTALSHQPLPLHASRQSLRKQTSTTLKSEPQLPSTDRYENNSKTLTG